MRALVIATEMTYPVTAVTATSTAVALIAPFVGTSTIGQEGVPGEDIGFSSSGSAVLAIELEGVTSNAGDSMGLQVSTNFYAQTVAGGTVTYAASKTYTLPATLTAKSKTIYLDRVLLGESVRLFVTATGTGGGGTVSAYLLGT